MYEQIVKLISYQGETYYTIKELENMFPYNKKMRSVAGRFRDLGVRVEANKVDGVLVGYTFNKGSNGLKDFRIECNNELARKLSEKRDEIKELQLEISLLKESLKVGDKTYEDKMRSRRYASISMETEIKSRISQEQEMKKRLIGFTCAAFIIGGLVVAVIFNALK